MYSTALSTEYSAVVFYVLSFYYWSSGKVIGHINQVALRQGLK